MGGNKTMNLQDNVLNDVKKYLTLNQTLGFNMFDDQLLETIDSLFSDIQQLTNYVNQNAEITKESTWDSLFDTSIGEEVKLALLKHAKRYIFLSTKMVFDPPPQSLNQYYSNWIDEAKERIRYNEEMRN